jgi:outer membrane immunogenic protein
MKKLLIATTALVACAAFTQAFAADMAARPYTKAPPAVMMTINDWGGLYIGFNAGGGSSRDRWNLVNGANEGTTNAAGAAVGGQIGYRYQMNNWVFGVEAQGDWANFNGNTRNLLNPAVTDRTRVNAFGLFTGQIGYAIAPNFLAYLKGGAALTNDRYDTVTTGTNVMLSRANTTRWGGTVGVGVEYAFAPNWSVGVEYDHLFMGNKNLNFVNLAGAAVTTRRINEDVDIGLVRVNYKFGPGGVFAPMSGLGMGMGGMK